MEEDSSDQWVWDSGALARDKHVKGFAVRDGNLLTGQQNFSGGETAQLIIETLGRSTRPKSPPGARLAELFGPRG